MNALQRNDMAVDAVLSNDRAFHRAHFPRFLPASLAAISLVYLPRMKTLLAPLSNQTRSLAGASGVSAGLTVDLRGNP
jgi:hypothetical protein